jgi:3-dehydroquinate synthase
MLAPLARGRRVVIVTQPRIASLWGEALLRSLRASGLDPELVSFPDGERFKTLRTLSALYRALYDLRADRQTLIAALGGGVVGDVAGFLAASYLRGLDYVQVPTTLLAMVDSSVGGKTGIDYRDGKNLIGAFHQPRAVLADIDTLATLPAREVRSGLAEVVKYGIIRAPEFLEYLEREADAVRRLDAGVMAEIVRRSCAIKAEVVAGDEREETGLRAILNFGHTIGHALESATRYRRFRHGEAIAIGMVSAACIGETAGCYACGSPPHDRARDRAQGLPVAIPAGVAAVAAPADLLGLLSLDKKARSGAARFVLARAIGDVALADRIPDAAFVAGLELQAREYGGNRGRGNAVDATDDRP